MESTFIKRILEIAAANPDKVAIVDNGGKRQTTYAELMLLAHKYVSYLHAKVETPQAFIAVKMPYCMEFLAAEIGIWLCRYAAVPLGVSYPEKRIEYIMQHSESPLMLTTDQLDEVQGMEPTEGTLPEVNDNAMLLYTSGSTGNPKGVLITYELLDNNVPRKLVPGMSMEDIVFGSSAPMYFAFSYCIWDVIHAGGTVHLYNDEIKSNVSIMEDYILQHDITVSQIGPAALLLFHNKSPKLKAVITAGEKLTTQYSKDGYTLYNLWGQTETGMAVTGYKMPEHPMNVIPIGKCRKGLEYKVVDGDDNIVKQGETGEICLRGPLFKEYYKSPELTQEAYRNGWLHTKDLVRVDENGDIIYVQRNDWMVKVNGQRVEPGEVEIAMLKIKGVTQAVVKGFDNGEGSQYLCGYFITDSNVDGETIRRELTANLPSYMVPAYYVKMESLPLNANGKLDRKGLQAPDLTSMQSEYVAPTNEVEAALCDAFAKVLKLERVGIDDDFFLLGGDSIRLMKLQQYLELKKIITMVNSGRTPRKIAELYAAMEKITSVGTVENGMYPITDIQKTYLDICLPLEGQPVMNVTNLLKLDDKVDLDRLAASICKALDYHPAMFVRFHRSDDGSVVQNIQKETVCLEVEHLTDEDFETLKPKLVKAFRYFEDRLFQFRLFKTPSIQYMFFNIHHSIFDGESESVLFADIERAYDNQDIEKEKDSYMNIALEENAMLGTDYYASAREGFRSMFKDSPRTLYVEGAGSDYLDSKQVTLSIKASEAASFCSENHTTMNTLTTAAFVMFLGTETGSRDVVFGSQFSGRTDASVSNMVGSFAKPIFLRFIWDEDIKTAEFLNTVNNTINRGIANSIYSLSEIMKDNLVDSQIQFVYQDQITLKPVVGGFPTTVVEFQRNQTPSTMVINIFRNTVTDELELRVAYRKDIFSSEKIDSMLKIYDENLRKLVVS